MKRSNKSIIPKGTYVPGIQDVDIQRIVITIEGTSPLITNRFDEKDFNRGCPCCPPNN